MADAFTEVTGLLARHGVHAGPLRRLIGLLCAGWQPFDVLIRESALPRRTVEELLAACGVDAERDGDRWRIVSDRVTAYRDLGMPRPVRALDQVRATADTTERRARWLAETYELAGAHVVCLGDHDLTSLAVVALRPDVAVTVVDLDEELLAYVDGHSGPVRCLHADLRFGLPPAVVAGADLVVTDPPYTPEGMRLFLARGIECLADPVRGRLVVAYGYSRRNPALGLAVQQEMQRLGLVFEAILPGFNRYHGAQAIGSASDLYVCQPTARSARLAAAALSPAARRTAVYTHGPQSVEAPATDPALVAALVEFAGGELVEPGWQEPVTRSGAVAVDLTADPGPWLLRMFLASTAGRVAALVGNNHPDIADARGQRALAGLLAPKYRLTFRRSTPDRAHAIVVADAVDAVDAVDASGVPAALLRRVHGKLGNLWREALIAGSGGTLTKRAARDLVAAAAPVPADLDLRLIDLPRHRIRAVLDAAEALPPHGGARAADPLR